MAQASAWRSLPRSLETVFQQPPRLRAGKVRAKGGTRTAVRLSDLGFELTDGQVRGLVEQAAAGMLLSDLLSLDNVLDAFEVQGSTEETGRLGEMLADAAALY